MTTTLTIVHVAISLVGIGAGFVVMWGLLVSKRLNTWNAIFLVATTATSVTGFFFPVERFTPGLALAIVSLIVLAPALASRYYYDLAGPWWRTYVITAMIAQYLNVVVLIVQSFQKIPSLRELAPTQTELPFALAQLVTLAMFIAYTTVAAVRFRPEPSTEKSDSSKSDPFESAIPHAREVFKVQNQK
jgi:hypothetical protein